MTVQPEKTHRSAHPAVLPTVYRVPLSLTDSQLEKLYALLTAEELARAARFAVRQPRNQFVGCRAALRWVLANALGCQPQGVDLYLQQWGKPALRWSSRSLHREEGQIQPDSLQFNISHSGDLGLIALASSAVGIDLESQNPRVHVSSLVNMVLSPMEMQAWRALPARDHSEQILRLWVCKESLLKALGLGIAECLQQIGFPLPVPTCEFPPTWIDPAIQLYLPEGLDCRKNDWTDVHSWCIHPLQIGTSHLAAVALRERHPSIAIRDFDWGWVL